jgi:hypothetical protein
MKHLARRYATACALAAQRVRDARHDDRAMTTETAIITAILAGLALAVTAVIVARANGWAGGIPSYGG